MLLIRREKIDGWLKAINRKHRWIAEMLGITKGYESLIINNHCKISTLIIERMLILTHIPFDELFSYDGKNDKREWFGASWWDDKHGYSDSIEDYHDYINSRLQNMKGNYNDKKGNGQDGKTEHNNL
jgi:transcriptional regulator with XRE-family HTH domain